MDGTIDVTIPVDAPSAAVLRSAHNREVIGRYVSQILNPSDAPLPLAQAIAEIKAEARAAGLTDEDIDAELAAHKAERRARQAG